MRTCLNWLGFEIRTEYSAVYVLYLFTTYIRRFRPLIGIHLVRIAIQNIWARVRNPRSGFCRVQRLDHIRQSAWINRRVYWKKSNERRKLVKALLALISHRDPVRSLQTGTRKAKKSHTTAGEEATLDTIILAFGCFWTTTASSDCIV
jgi:hypothetical protein